MSKKTESIMVRVTPERKEQWEKIADDKGMSVPALIRHSVEQLGSGTDSSVENVEGLDEMTETVETVDERTEDIQSQLSTLSAAIGDMKQLVDGEVSSVEEQKVLEHIPEKGDCMVKHQSDSGVSEELDPLKTVSPSSVAKQIDYENPPTEAVRRTLEQIALRSPRIKSITYNEGQAVGYYIDV